MHVIQDILVWKNTPEVDPEKGEVDIESHRVQETHHVYVKRNPHSDDDYQFFFAWKWFAGAKYVRAEWREDVNEEVRVYEVDVTYASPEESYFEDAYGDDSIYDDY